MSTAATPTGRHRPEDDGETRRRFTRRGKTLAGALAALTTTGAILAGTALAGPGIAPPPGDEATPAAAAAHHEPAVPGTPCSVSTRACVDLEKQIAWLIRDGKVTRGPMRISSGGHGEATPVGHSLRVYRKEKDYKSNESRLPNGQPAPMPYSVFFQDGGIAFHGGSPDRASGGCIHMALPDAIATFNDLQMGDKVQTVLGSVEWNARHPGKKP
jgi:lipoprotein-anchoring transpeptidase ErfK/SrfK